MNDSSKRKGQIDAHSKTRGVSLSLNELSEDIGAFLHFLREKIETGEEGSSGSEICSVWMLIPKAIDVTFRSGIIDCRLEKDIHSRTIWIVSEPVNKDKEIDRRRELLKYFSNIIADDQMEQVKILLSGVGLDDRNRILEEFRSYKDSLAFNGDK